jgi:hypothetical protein
MKKIEKIGYIEEETLEKMKAVMGTGYMKRYILGVLYVARNPNREIKEKKVKVTIEEIK